MDAAKAQQVFSDLQGRGIAGYVIQELLGYGKSAAVYKAAKGKQTVALKIFDSEIVEKYGSDVQIKRIEREIELTNFSHENMIKIIDGGIEKETKSHYIVMEYLEGRTLSSCIGDVPEDRIPDLIRGLANAAHALEEMGLCHRDIKPDNIIVFGQFTKLVLLDFGVLRPMGASDLTDIDEIRSFVGTLRYSSPEFLLREENDSIEGWRALTFYQIGAVMHDMIMKKPIFLENSHPYAKLVNAVQNEVPDIVSESVGIKTAHLARSCLIKSPAKRLELVSWNDFDSLKLNNNKTTARDRIKKKAEIVKASAIGPIAAPVRHENFERKVLDFIKSSISSLRNDDECIPNGTCYVSPQKGRKFIIVTFDPLPLIELENKVHIAIVLEIEDLTSKMITLYSDAWVGDISSKEIASEFDGCTIYCGIYNDDVVLDVLTHRAYEVLEKATTLSLSPDERYAGIGEK